MRRSLLALGGCAVLAVAGCSNGMHDAAPTTTRPPPTTVAAPNPDAIPPVITVAYVNAVFAILNHVNGDAVRDLVAYGSVTPEVKSYLRATYNDPLYAKEVAITQQSVSDGFQNVRNPPGDRVTTVDRIIYGSTSCIFVSSETTYGAVLLHATPPATSEYWKLERKQTGIDPRHLNPTPWALSFNASYTHKTTVPNQCEES
jgi:hypothetical protein